MNEPRATEIAVGIVVVDDFMAHEECRSWIEFSEQRGYEPAAISVGQRQVIRPEVRNNERLIYDSLELAEEMWQRVEGFIPNNVMDMEKCGLNERWRFYKYQAGQQFKAHKDGSYYRSINEWSAYTFMVYLNEEMKGGATNFRGHSIRPATGRTLIFAHQLVHEGAPIVSGLKYVLRTDVMYRRKKKLVIPD